ncbi:hypothetical protein OMP38_14520 [Cohnella ginsengisoli]|uniref:RNA polymerase sigma-70 region 4 domain-containing protein n=1 Tax=Cohnella ginsengisoli TaxID=425004 RepID=A0A9X4QMZ9_9BACL|nr:hypothetical protein [Cohnella ginsengisoli]MDG0791931.1 hypothetical protein [Cohnella ginsengisoli]
MTNDQLIQLLTDYKSYKFALKNVGKQDLGIPLYQAERMRMLPNEWDGTRYARIVEMIDGAINELLTDDQRMVIMRKYIDRENASLTKIGKEKNIHCSSISRWHTEALRRLRVALEPLTSTEWEITNVDHMLSA